MWQEQPAPVFKNQLFLLKLISVESWLAVDDEAINQKLFKFTGISRFGTIVIYSSPVSPEI